MQAGRRSTVRLKKEDAMELIDRLPYIRTLQVNNDKIRLELYYDFLESDEPAEWVRIIKTHYVRKRDDSLRRRPSQQEEELAAQAKEKLQKVLSESLGIGIEQIEQFIADHLADEL